MEKKAIVLKILEKLTPLWDLAEGLKLVVQEGNLEDNMLDALITLLGQSVHAVKTEKEKRAFEKGKNLLEKIRQMEEDEKIENVDLDLDLFD